MTTETTVTAGGPGAAAAAGPLGAPPARERPARSVLGRVPDPVIEIGDLSLHYGPKQALSSISMAIPSKRITAFIGPSGCGKSSLLRCINRLNDLIPTARVEGEVRFAGADVYDPTTDVNRLRKRIGMVFQKPNPFPRSIYDNIAYGCKIQGYSRKSELDGLVEESLRSAALWDEVKDRLHDDAFGLSGGQQQRLCIARAIATRPEVLLFDEPCSALDPIATARIEELMQDLKERYTQVIVTHNMQQASRVSDYTAFLYLGELIEYGITDEIFVKPKVEATEQYITGRFG